MYRLIFAMLLFVSVGYAQTKKPADKPVPGKNNKMAAKKDSVKAEPVKEEPVVIPKTFSVYSRKAKAGKDRNMKLCINLVKDTTILNYCINDSICKNPEVFKVLFEKQDADTNYVVVYVDAFSKPDDKPACDAGHETKLFFARWNLKTNKAIWKQRSISSCMRGIDNMTKEPIAEWDGASVLHVNYYKGNSQFVDIKFDPANYRAGFQNSSGEEASKEGKSD